MTKLEKLKRSQEAYYALIPGLKEIALQDYALVMCDAPAYLKELIAEEEKRADGSDLSDGSDKSGNEEE